MFPVGISIITNNPVNPATYLGFGQWGRDCEGRAIVGVTTDITANSPDWVKTVDSEFGEYDHQITVDEMPTHDHNNGIVYSGNGHIEGYFQGAPQVDNYSLNRTTAVGGDQPHNNVQPSKTKFIFTRIA